MNIIEEIPDIGNGYSKEKINTLSDRDIGFLEQKFIKSCILKNDFLNLNKYIKLKNFNIITDDIVYNVISSCDIKHSKNFLINIKNKEELTTSFNLAIEKSLLFYCENMPKKTKNEFLKKIYVLNLYQNNFDNLKYIHNEFDLNLSEDFIDIALTYNEPKMPYILIPLYYKKEWKDFVIEFLNKNPHLIDNFNQKMAVQNFKKF